MAATAAVEGITGLAEDRAVTALNQPTEPSGAALSPGTLVGEGRYQIDHVLGRGGFGITYAALDRRLQRRVALKELFPTFAERCGCAVVASPHDAATFADARHRLVREARLLARFSTPGVVCIYEAFEGNGTAYLVMELLDGCSLATVAAERSSPFPGGEVVEVLREVGAALAAVHEAGVLHRDVSPANIVVTRDGHLTLIDFGIARSIDHASGPVTRLVTPGYAPPEQYLEDAALTPATDVYALAATGFRLATGVTPASAPQRLAGTRLQAPWRLNDTVTKAVSDALLDGLELDPSHRPRDVATFLARLGAPLRGEEGTNVVTNTTAAFITGTVVTAAAGEGGPSNVPTAAFVAPGFAGRDTVTGGRSTVHPPSAPGPPRGADRIAPGPRAVGPERRGRRAVLVPLLVAVVVFASATPVVAAAIVVLVALPALATLGDAIVHRHRRQTGQRWRAWHGWSPTLVLPVRAVRNVGMSVIRAVPTLAFGAVMVGFSAVLDHAGAATVLVRGVVRFGGALVGFGLAWPATSRGAGFRSGLGLDRLVDRVLDTHGRYEVTGWALLLACIAVVAGGLWLTPEIWPL